MVAGLKLGIRGRLISGFVVGAIGAVALGGTVVYVTGLKSIQGTLGQTYCQIASRIGDQFETRIGEETGQIRRIATDALTTDVVMDSHGYYGARPQDWIDSKRRREEAEWQALGSDRERQAALSRPLSHRLSVLAQLRPETVSRYLAYDSQGILLGASESPPARRWAVDDPWFKAIRDERRHFTYLSLDRAGDRLEIAIPVWGGVEIVGYVKADLIFSTVSGEIRQVNFGSSGEAVLVDYAGVPLGGQPRGRFIQAMAARPQPEDAAATRPYWIALGEGAGLWKRLVCIAPLPVLNGFRDRFGLPSWSLIVTQAPEESYAALRESLGTLGAAGLAFVAVVGMAGAFMAWLIATPLKELQAGVRRFARGERDQRVEVSSSDEIGELAAEFNRMAERVTDSENELRAFAQAVADAADAILMTDPEGRIYYSNPAFETITGYSLNDIQGELPSILSAGEADRKVYDSLWDKVKAGRAWRGELEHRRSTGEAYPVDMTFSPIHDESGRTVSLLSIHRDISLSRAYRQQLEQEVEERTREISETQGLTAMGRMASMIAHDLRNSLSTIKMTLQILERRRADKDEVEKEHCEMGLDQVRYMEHILRDMLSFARPDRLQQDWQDVPTVLDGAIATVTASLSNANITIERHGDAGLPKVYCDRVKMMQVLQNLLENAIQSSPEGAKIDLSTRLVMDAPVPSVEIRLRDTGEGIPDDVLNDVFEPFFTTRAKGSGLGLTIVQRIIEQHGGQIAIRSKEGEGTEVRVSLPSEPMTTGDDM